MKARNEGFMDERILEATREAFSIYSGIPTSGQTFSGRDTRWSDSFHRSEPGKFHAESEKFSGYFNSLALKALMYATSGYFDEAHGMMERPVVQRVLLSSVCEVLGVGKPKLSVNSQQSLADLQEQLKQFPAIKELGILYMQLKRLEEIDFKEFGEENFHLQILMNQTQISLTRLVACCVANTVARENKLGSLDAVMSKFHDKWGDPKQGILSETDSLAELKRICEKHDVKGGALVASLANNELRVQEGNQPTVNRQGL